MRTVSRHLTILVATAAVLLWASTGRAASRSYSVDTASSLLTVQVFRGGLLAGFGHDHMFAVQRWSGLIRFDPSAPANAHVELRVAADSLRDRQPDLSESDRAKVDRQARDQVLEAGRYPTIEFLADRIELDPPGPMGNSDAEGQVLRGTLIGTLTLHGQSKSLRVPFRATLSPDGIVAAAGDVRLSLRDFGIKVSSAGLGTVKVKDEVVVRFALSASPSH